MTVRNDFTYCISSICPAKTKCLRYVDQETDNLRGKPLAFYYQVTQRDTCPMFIDIVRPPVYGTETVVQPS